MKNYFIDYIKFYYSNEKYLCIMKVYNSNNKTRTIQINQMEA